MRIAKHADDINRGNKERGSELRRKEEILTSKPRERKGKAKRRCEEASQLQPQENDANEDRGAGAPALERPYI